MSEPFKLRHPKDGRLHFSDAKRMAVSPKAARWFAEHPRDSTPAMRRGTAIDRLVLGERRKLIVCTIARGTGAWRSLELIATGADLAVYPGAVKRGKEYEAFEAANPGKEIALEKDYQVAWDLLKGERCDLGEIVTPEEYELANGAAQAVLTDPVVRDMGLLVGEQQRVVHWEMNGLPWAAGIAKERGGFDVLGDGFINDLKSTSCVEIGWLSRQVRKMNYVEQIYSYGQGATFIGKKPERYHLTCVEVAPPFDVTVLTIPPQEIEDAGRVVYGWCEKIRQCEEADFWPGRYQSAVEIEARSVWDLVGEAEEA